MAGVYMLPPIHWVTLSTPLLVLVVMLRRNQTNITLEYPSPLPRSVFSSGRRGRGLATNQRAFRSSAAESTLEIKSPQFETPQRPTPPALPRRTPTSHLPSGVSGIRRQPTRHNTRDTYTHALGGHLSSRNNSRRGTADVTDGIHAKVWPTYNKISRAFDEGTLRKWDSDFNVILIFVSLVAGGDYQSRLD